MQFVVLADINADDFISRVSVPIFREPTAGRPAWLEMESIARKHDTFVYGPDGLRTLFWDASAHDLQKWSTEIRAAVEAIGR